MSQPGSWRRRRYGPLAVGALLLLAAARPTVARSGSPDAEVSRWDQPRNVLLLHAYPRLSPAVVSVDEAFRETLAAASPFPVYFYTEYLDLTLLDGDMPRQELRALLHRKYASRGIDLIVAAGSRALRVALSNREDLFSGAPVVFVAVDRASVADLRLSGDVTGTWLRQSWLETLSLARRLQPSTRRVVVVAGASPADLTWLGAARQQLAATSPREIELSYFTGGSIAQVRERVASLPKDTIVLVGAFQRDATGQDFSTPDAVARIAAASTVPVYVLQDQSVGTGVVGGHVVSFEAHGRTAAGLALRVLRGEQPPPTDAGTTVAMIDWRQLQRWRLDARQLPAGSVVLFREPSLWETHRWWIVGAIVLVLLQSALIAVLLVHRALRRRVRLALAERVRFETLLADLSVMFAAGSASDVDRQIETGLRRIVDDLGIDRATVAALDAVARRRAGHAFLDPRGRGASSRGESGQPDAVDHVRAPPGSRRSLPALRRAPRERSGGQAEPRAIRHALGRYRAARRGQHRRRRPLRGHPPRGASVVRRDGPAAPAAGRRLRRRPRAAAGRTGRARERGALPSDGGQRAGDGVALGTRWPTDVREPAVARLHRPPPGRRAPRGAGWPAYIRTIARI